ncbi:MAG: TetR/AcrR family transcriptional regulator [Lachnospiraceae bacterium]|nr:TetR/AcrR family transcriptional regulator [Lachnospiraceae bacterium]
MGKVEDNKKRKKNAIVDSSFSLFIQNGINETSIADIMKKAELAKGTFYLYFKDKYDVRDYLIRKKAAQIFDRARVALVESHVKDFEEQIIFMVDHILNQLDDNKTLLKFISKNLSWGIFTHALESMPMESGETAVLFVRQLFEDSGHTFRNPEMLMFMIVELVNSTAHNVILYKQPVELPELKKELYPMIRQLIHNFEVTAG